MRTMRIYRPSANLRLSVNIFIKNRFNTLRRRTTDGKRIPISETLH